MKEAMILLLAVTVICGSPSSTKAQEAAQGPPPPVVAPQVRPALPQEQQLPVPREQDAVSRAKAEADKARRRARAEERQRLVEETRSRGYWVDPTTKLVWTGHDNGIPVTWHKADSYCKDLRLAGYSDWRLATLDELATLVDKTAASSDRVGNAETFTINLGLPVQGGLSLSGNSWSSTRKINRFGKPYEDGWFFDFANSRPSGDLPYFRNTKYALCVRRS